ncbi:hypothetical protein [Fodinicola feengrottensis]|uniref:hypothetical protein n=1 Tax=Fodinicola feengrottensis TaxID=435914 RepID=UPI0013D708BA|nr:hypothetical protein [Fodinicola feengrottensis]
MLRPIAFEQPDGALLAGPGQQRCCAMSGARKRLWKPLAVAAGSIAVVTVASVLATAWGDTSPKAGTPETVTADPLSTWQTDGIVWSLAQAGSTVFAGGNFDFVRPPGTTPGDYAQLSRSNLAAFDVATGKPTTFAHAVTGTAYVSNRLGMPDDRHRRIPL